jgi:hypothetical protein
MDWYEWSIDSPMIRRFADKIVLVIGLRDRFIVLNHDSPVLKLCRVIYTDTRHGMCIFSDFLGGGNLRSREPTVLNASRLCASEAGTPTTPPLINPLMLTVI